jgi:hypothetical protein
MQEENLDRELDAALANYAAVEPREGLEQRVLANLRARPVKETGNWEWLQGRTAVGLVTVAAAMLVICAAVNSFARKAALPRLSVEQKVANSEAADPGTQAQSNLVAQIEAGKRMGRSARQIETSGVRKPRIVATRRETTPRLSQFPAPEPLSEQERLLIRYVEDDPERAELIAEATTLAERTSVANDVGGSSLRPSPEEER